MVHLLETKKLTKVFGDFTANKDVDFWCDEGKVTSLLGENGAGKTTLMNTIYGLYQPDGGEIVFDGKAVHFKSPRDAIACEIQMVHQHFMLIDEFTVAENVVMGNEPVKRGLFHTKEARRRVLEISDAYHFGIDPALRVSDLSVGEKQKVEIIKALYHGARLLILDEPTAVLTPQETEGLFQVIRRLKSSGKSIIIITHKLHETMEIADEIFVLRHGVMGGFVKKEETDPYKLTCMMVDHQPREFKKEMLMPGETALHIEELDYVREDGSKALDRLSLDVHSREIYGIAGIEGNGQLELLEVISGILKGWTGQLEVLGEDISGRTTRQIVESGAAFIHSDRMERGLLLGQDAAMNAALGNQYSDLVTSKHKIDYKKIDRMLEEIFEKYQVSPRNKALPLKNFSGGNQQKMIIGREFYRNPRLAVIAHPTRGVDIGVCEIIHESILELKRQGAAILLITADFDELFRLSDRIGVIYEGHMVTEDIAEAFTPTKLGFYMGGGRENED